MSFLNMLIYIINDKEETAKIVFLNSSKVVTSADLPLIF